MSNRFPLVALVLGLLLATGVARADTGRVENKEALARTGGSPANDQNRGHWGQVAGTIETGAGDAANFAVHLAIRADAG